MRRKSGYTLFETLIVLMIVCSFVLLPTLMFSNWQRKLEERSFYYQLEKSILHLQQLAICDQKNARIDLHPDKQLITFTAVDEEIPWKNLEVPKYVVLHSGYSVMFKSSTGNVSTNQPETGIPKIRFTDRSGEVIYQFQLGSGRFEKK
ncbi:competence type IV pilus minor pilin ComGD [Candidatus Enterococcus ferrettii]|uniref:Competence protein ComGD n=1 Tax=Candidatus Enterococcus ferrettii TaxID=2815324 RepID=A0ABV0EWV3_9ENTE|nr:competence type IV pilus minor pilin ComGD [Enterococcus sp. 665A]MBO1338755.1 prepilin-type N-terminal cleavage/methylation domain-containing protein [Enterococcus sp. 665A]